MASTTAIPTKEMESVTINDDQTDSTSASNPNIHTESFAMELTSDSLLGNALKGNQKAIVATITFFNKSVMVWIGRGDLEDGENDGTNQVTYEKNSGVLGTGLPTGGPLVVAMPRSKYTGFGSNDEVPCSQLIGGANDEEVMLGWQMASRLTKKVGWPIFVSTSLYQNDTSMNELGDTSLLHAAALTEKKIGDIILKRNQINK
jgi:hypothetical protein